MRVTLRWACHMEREQNKFRYVVRYSLPTFDSDKVVLETKLGIINIRKRTYLSTV